VHVYKQHCKFTVTEVVSAQGGGATATASVEPGSIQPAEKPVSQISLPGVGDLLWQPCFFISVQACNDAGGGYGEAFLGVLVNERLQGVGRERIVPLSAPLHTRCLVTQAFAKRDELRAHLFPSAA